MNMHTGLELTFTNVGSGINSAVRSIWSIAMMTSPASGMRSCGKCDIPKSCPKGVCSRERMKGLLVGLARLQEGRAITPYLSVHTIPCTYDKALDTFTTMMPTVASCLISNPEAQPNVYTYTRRHASAKPMQIHAAAIGCDIEAELTKRATAFAE